MSEIPRQREFLHIKEHLYCITTGCNAKLVFNQRSTGKNYLSKHKAFVHSEDCVYYNDEITHVNSITEYVEVNGKISSDGIKRRKSDAMKALKEHLNPTEQKPQNTTKKSGPNKERGGGPKDVTTVIKVVYDPLGEVIPKEGADGEIKIKEPPFYERLPHQISSKDNGKNLRTSIIIRDIRIGRKKNDYYAEISGDLENVKITFVLPEEFFVASETNINKDQLLGFIRDLKTFVENGETQLFLTSLCQAQVLDMNDIVLYILESYFMCFQTYSGREFDSLTNVIVAIATKVIK